MNTLYIYIYIYICLLVGFRGFVKEEMKPQLEGLRNIFNNATAANYIK